MSEATNAEGAAMTKYTWIVFTNAAPGREEEFDRWYNEVHVPDLMRVPGITGVVRARLGPSQTKMTDAGIALVPSSEAGLAFGYVAIYAIETDDIDTVLKTVATRAGTDEMVMSETLVEFSTMCFEDIMKLGSFG